MAGAGTRTGVVMGRDAGHRVLTEWGWLVIGTQPDFQIRQTDEEGQGG